MTQDRHFLSPWLMQMLSLILALVKFRAGLYVAYMVIRNICRTTYVCFRPEPRMRETPP